jgi:hypothetical protein
VNKKSAQTILPKKTLSLNKPKIGAIAIEDESKSIFYRIYNIFLWAFIACSSLFILFLIIEIYSKRQIYSGAAYNFASSQSEKEQVLTDTQNPEADLKSMWSKTNFSKTDVDLNTIYSAGPIKDAIPAIYEPKFIDVSTKSAYVPGDTRGLYVEVAGVSKFYPIDILVWHEVVNDTIGGIPVAVTYCPLTGTSAVFSRLINNKANPMVFGVSGLLHNSNLVMYDLETETLWSQNQKKAIVGDLASTELEPLSFQFITYEQALTRSKIFLILSKDTGFVRDYLSNPYAEYEFSDDVYSEFGLSYDQPDYQAKKEIVTFVLQGTKYGFFLEDLESNGTLEITDEDGAVLKANLNNGFIKITLNRIAVDDFSFEYWFSWIKSSRPTKLFTLKS